MLIDGGCLVLGFQFGCAVIFCRYFLFTFVRVIPNLTKLTTNSIHDLDDRGGHDVSSHVARARTARHNSTHQHSRIVSKIHIDTHSLN